MTPASADVVVTIVGSGTCVPSLRRSACAVLMETGCRRLLLDAGPGTMRRLLELGVEIFDIDAVFFSHFHPDHTGELVPLLFASKYSPARQRQRPLQLAGGRGFNDFFDGLRGVYGDWIELAPGCLEIFEFDNRGPDRRDLGGCSVATLPVRHRPESVGFRVTGPEGGTAVYSGDTDVCDSLIRLARDADLFVCEAALPDALKAAGHLTPSEAGRIASQAGVRKLVLTHFYPSCDRADMEGQCRQTYGGPLVLAEDGLRFALP